MAEEHLLLKWGTLTGWKLESDEAKELMGRYLKIGASASAMFQHDTDEQKQILCDLIDAVDGEIQSDWSGEMLTKEEAKKYVMEYGR